MADFWGGTQGGVSLGFYGEAGRSLTAEKYKSLTEQDYVKGQLAYARARFDPNLPDDWMPTPENKRALYQARQKQLQDAYHASMAEMDGYLKDIVQGGTIDQAALAATPGMEWKPASGFYGQTPQQSTNPGAGSWDPTTQQYVNPDGSPWVAGQPVPGAPPAPYDPSVKYDFDPQGPAHVRDNGGVSQLPTMAYSPPRPGATPPVQNAPSALPPGMPGGVPGPTRPPVTAPGYPDPEWRIPPNPGKPLVRPPAAPPATTVQPGIKITQFNLDRNPLARR